MVLENLDAVGCMGILATHLHGVLDMELRTRHVARMAMGTVVEDDVSGRPVRRATWKMVDGEVGRHLKIRKSSEANVSCFPTWHTVFCPPPPPGDLPPCISPGRWLREGSSGTC
jgi:hypothetical protein